jgi:hypothetical protein
MRKRQKTLSPKKSKKGQDFFDKKAIKEKETMIKVLEYELIASTLSYLILAPW